MTVCWGWGEAWTCAAGVCLAGGVPASLLDPGPVEVLLLVFQSPFPDDC